MSRNVPTVRPWRVLYWLETERKPVAEYKVEAPNAQFARWAAAELHRTRWKLYRINGLKLVSAGANEQFPLFVDRITVSRVHPPKVQP